MCVYCMIDIENWLFIFIYIIYMEIGELEKNGEVLLLGNIFDWF